MPTSETPTDLNEPLPPTEASNGLVSGESDSRGSGSRDSDQALRAPISAYSGASRWVDYDTHELLSMISELEDERRFARLREGILWAVLFHIALISALTWIPMYVLKQPRIVDPFDAIKQRKDLTYLDLPPDALKNIKPKVTVKPVKPLIDQKTMDEMKRDAPPKPVEQAPAPTPEPEQPKPQPTQPVPPTQNSQLDAPRPAAVPARPNFAMQSQNPADQLQQAMKDAMKNRNSGGGAAPSGGGLSMHPGAGTGGVQVLSDTQGVDFSNWLERWHYVTQRTWDPLIPDEVNPPLNKSGVVAVQFKVLPNGRIMDGSMQLVGRSGDSALDRAAWGALTGSSYPSLPKDFHGPYLELRAYFLYNMQPQ